MHVFLRDRPSRFPFHFLLLLFQSFLIPSNTKPPMSHYFFVLFPPRHLSMFDYEIERRIKTYFYAKCVDRKFIGNSITVALTFAILHNFTGKKFYLFQTFMIKADKTFNPTSQLHKHTAPEIICNK